MTITKQKSLHGLQAFVSTEDHLVGRKGLGTGGPGKTTILHPSADITASFDDFHGDALDARWITNEGSDTGSHATQGILSGTVNGVARLESGTGNADAASSISILARGKHFKANQGGVRMSSRVKIPTTTNVSVYVGFTDDTGTAEAAIWEDTGSAAQVSTATDAVGFLFDTANSHTKWQTVGVKAGTDATPVDLDTGPNANQYDELEICLDTGGDALFSLNGQQVAFIADAVTPTVALTPIYSIWPHGTAQRTLDIDFDHASANRDTGT